MFEAQYASIVGELRAWWDGNVHHGCFCGAGSSCDEPIDGLDRCCKQHDDDYDERRHSADTMWTIDGFIDCQQADAALAACAADADLSTDDAHRSTDPSSFRDHLIWLFSTRASIGAGLHAWQERLRALEDAWDGLSSYLGASWTPVTEGDATAVAGVQEHVTYLRSLECSDEDITARLARTGFDVEAIRHHLFAG